MSDDYNPFEPDETPEQLNRRIAQMIRENVDKRLAKERGDNHEAVNRAVVGED